MDTMAIANILAGLLALGIVSLLTRHSLEHPERITRFLHDTPTIVMYLLGAWLLAPLGWPWAAGYMVCVVVTNLWFLARVCSRCPCHGRKKDGPSFYCVMASHLAEKGDVAQFAQSFRRNTKVIALCWILPPLGGIVLASQSYDRAWMFAGNIVMVMAFSLIGFWLLPAGAKPRCERCDNWSKCPQGQLRHQPDIRRVLPAPVPKSITTSAESKPTEPSR